jgi:hypothetical protein
VVFFALAGLTADNLTLIIADTLNREKVYKPLKKIHPALLRICRDGCFVLRLANKISPEAFVFGSVAKGRYLAGMNERLSGNVMSEANGMKRRKRMK